MKNLFLKTIVEKLGGKILQGSDNLIIHDIAVRIKRVQKGTLLLDLYHDQARNLEVYFKDYSCAVITDRPENFKGIGKNVTLIQVSNMDDATWNFIDYYRSLFRIPVIGVTGTCGKTTTKEMIKHIMSGVLRVNATYKSYNAAFRHFSYLLDMDDQTQAAVYEMGLAYPGDLLRSGRFYKPHVGVITNIGIDHLNAFGKLDNYIQGKGEMLEALGNRGTLVLNADDENTKKIDLSKFKGNIVYFGFSEKSHYTISNVTPVEGGFEFNIHHRDKNYKFFVPGNAEFNVYNATAAIAATHAIGFDLRRIADRLATFKNVEKHFELVEGINGSTIIDDTWSTNPTSAEIALKLLKTNANGKKTVAVLGKMSLLGRHSSKYHYNLGEKISEIGIDNLVVMGDKAVPIAIGALEKGMPENCIYIKNNSDEAYEVLKEILDENSIVLIKTSMLTPYNDLLDRIIKKE